MGIKDKMSSKLVELAKSAWRYELGLDELEGFKKGLKNFYKKDDMSEKDDLDFGRSLLRHYLSLNEIILMSHYLTHGSSSGTKATLTFGVFEAVKYLIDKGMLYVDRNKDYVEDFIRRHFKNNQQGA